MTTLLADHVRLSRTAHAAHGEVDGELIALDLDAGECLGFDRIGTQIWHLLKQPQRFDELIAALTREYDVEPDQCRADVEPLLTAFEQAGMIVIER